MNSTTEHISDALQLRLASISVANGFETDIGLKVFRGRRALEEEDLPCVVIAEGPEVVEQQRATEVAVGARYLLEAHDHCDPTHPNDRGHSIVRDLKRAVFGGERLRGSALGGLAKHVNYRGKTIAPREDGEAIVFASIGIEVQFTEDLANP